MSKSFLKTSLVVGALALSVFSVSFASAATTTKTAPVAATPKVEGSVAAPTAPAGAPNVAGRPEATRFPSDLGSMRPSSKAATRPFAMYGYAGAAAYAFLFFALLFFVYTAYMLTRCLKKEFKSPVDKVLWFIFIFTVPAVGAFCYHVCVHRQK